MTGKIGLIMSPVKSCKVQESGNDPNGLMIRAVFWSASPLVRGLQGILNYRTMRKNLTKVVVP